MGLQAILDSHGSFDLVLIMLGTNDVAEFDIDLPSVVSQEIFEDIKRLHVLCHQRGIPTVALSVPENKFLHLKRPEEDYLECWHTVNKLLAEWSSSEEASGHVLRFIDTSKILPWSKQPDCIHLWEKDGLHFAPPGSEHLGVEIAAKLSDILCSENYMKGANTAASDHGCGEAHDKDDKKVGEDVAAVLAAHEGWRRCRTARNLVGTKKVVGAKLSAGRTPGQKRLAFQRGMQVEATGLTRRADLNGKVGIVKGKKVGSESETRIVVAFIVDGGEQAVMCRPENLKDLD
jgi:hypothetical protein